MFRITFEGPKYLSEAKERKEAKEKFAIAALKAIMQITRYHTADENTVSQKAWELAKAMLEAYPEDKKD